MTLGPSNCPKILVGLKSDLREEYLRDPQKAAQCITTERGEQARKEFAFQAYLECSAKKRQNLT